MIRVLLGFVRKELIQTLRDPRMRVILFVMPMIQLVLFGVAISNEVRNIRLAAVYDSRDPILQKIYEKCLASGWFIRVKTSGQDPFTMVQSGAADAVLIPPAGGFSRALVRGDAQLQVLVNAMNVVRAQSIESYLKSIVGETSRKELKLPQVRAPIRFNVRVLFNPELETAVFMVPGTLCTLMVIVTMVMTSLSIVREKEMGSFEMLVSAPVSATEVILGKTIPYVILGVSSLPLVLAVAVFVFRVPMRGSLVVLFIAALSFICTTVSLGTLISTFCRNQQQATLAGLLFIFPMIIFSGLLFPVENMPVALRWISSVDPLAQYIGLLRNIMLKGGETGYVSVRVAILLGMALFSAVASFRRFRTTLQ